jgi:putative restriction endonuclease
MGFAVFVHRADSIYEDSPAEQYQFPSQYLSRVEACVGDWIVYYEPTKIAETRGYFAVARVQRVIPDPVAPGMYLALIEPRNLSRFR